MLDPRLDTVLEFLNQEEDPSPPPENDDDASKFGQSPRRAAVRKRAYEEMEKQAGRMKKRAFTGDKHGVVIDVGCVVQFGAADVDRAKTDVTNVTAVVVEHVTPHEADAGAIVYRVAAAEGPLKGLYARYQLRPLPTVKPAVVGLERVLATWRDMKPVGERTCMRAVSMAGGQGHVHCQCTSNCSSTRCTCRKLNRRCNSRCHKNNKKCRNLDACEECN